MIAVTITTLARWAEQSAQTPPEPPTTGARMSVMDTVREPAETGRDDLDTEKAQKPKSYCCVWVVQTESAKQRARLTTHHTAAPVTFLPAFYQDSAKKRNHESHALSADLHIPFYCFNTHRQADKQSKINGLNEFPFRMLAFKREIKSSSRCIMLKRIIRCLCGLVLYS